MEQKEIYEVVKYFKAIYTKMHVKESESMYVSGAKFYYPSDPHYLLLGEFDTSVKNPFTDWLASGKEFVLDLKQVDALRSCLKKNIVSLDSGEGSLVLKYKDKEEKDTEFRLTKLASRDSSFLPLIAKVERIESELNESLPFAAESFGSKDVLQVYLDGNGSLTSARTISKLIEIPLKRVFSLMEESASSISYSKETPEGMRFIRISSSGNGIKLHQIFATI
jgi:hypothetical protein